MMETLQGIASLIYRKCILYLRVLLSSVNKELLLASILVLFSLGLLLFLSYRIHGFKQQTYKQPRHGLLSGFLASLPFIGSFWTKSLAGLQEQQQAKSRKDRRRVNISAETTQSSKLTPQCDLDVIIVGSGVLGSALAAVLARDGRKVTVIEKDMKEPNTIAGELLHPGGYNALKDLGLKEAVEGINACTISRYIFHDLDSKLKAEMLCPKTADGQVQCGRSFHHGPFVMGLRRAAMAEPNAKFIEGRVLRLLEEDDRVVGVAYKDNETGDIKELHAPLTVVADGILSKFRKNLTSSKITVQSYLVGCILKDVPDFQPDHGELISGNNNISILYPISSSEVRLLLNIPGELPKNIKEHLIEMFHPHLPENLQEPFLRSIQNDDWKAMPGSFLPPAPADKAGVLLLGDAYNIRHPVTGSGMSVILSDIKLWRRLLQAVPDLYEDSALLQAKKTFFHTRRKSYSFVVNVFSQVFYAFYTASDESLRILRQITIRYFCLFGNHVFSPVALLALVSPRPILLFAHFFGMTIYGIYFIFKSQSWIHFPRAFFPMMYHACSVVLPLIYSEVKYIFY